MGNVVQEVVVLFCASDKVLYLCSRAQLRKKIERRVLNAGISVVFVKIGSQPTESL